MHRSDSFFILLFNIMLLYHCCFLCLKKIFLKLNFEDRYFDNILSFAFDIQIVRNLICIQEMDIIIFFPFNSKHFQFIYFKRSILPQLFLKFFPPHLNKELTCTCLFLTLFSVLLILINKLNLFY